MSGGMTLSRRSLIAAAPLVLMSPAVLRAQEAEDGAPLAPLKAVAVARGGETLAVNGYGGFDPAQPSNIKSASKSIVCALAGAAVMRGHLEGPDQKVAPILRDALPADPDRRLEEMTLAHLMSMRAGLERTSGGNYGAWVSSRDWLRDALRRPFVDEPGGRMLYSTGTTHILGAVIARAAGDDLLTLARDWLGPVEGFRITWWEQDPQGRYLAGNQMSMSVESLLAFGEMARRGGVAADGTRVLPEGWMEASWEPRTRSRWTGAGYGWGWFLGRVGPHPVRYGWGYGGQMIYVVPSLEMSVAMLSDETRPSARTGYRGVRHGELARMVREADGGGEPTLPVV